MILDFLREDFGEVIGAYYDGEKIFLSRHFNGETEKMIFPKLNSLLKKFLSYVLNAAGKLPKWDFVCVKVQL